jgi:hypothetical protein
MLCLWVFSFCCCTAPPTSQQQQQQKRYSQSTLPYTNYINNSTNFIANLYQCVHGIFHKEILLLDFLFLD